MALEQEREQTLDLLAEAYAHDHLSLEEYEARVGRALACAAASELDALLEGLPSAPSRRPPAGFSPAPPAPAWAGPQLATIMSSRSFDQSIMDGRPVASFTLMGETRFDLSGWSVPEGVTDINIFCLMGSCTLRLPRGATVENQVVPIMGDCRMRSDRDRPPRGQRVVRLTGAVIMGELTVVLE